MLCRAVSRLSSACPVLLALSVCVLLGVCARVGAGVFGAKNVEKRFACYQKCAALLLYRHREPLPMCVVATVRAIYPSADGHYTGFRPA